MNLKRALFLTAYLVAVAGLLLAAAEVTVRLRGYRPWTRGDADIQVEPGGSFYQPHPTLGYRHLPGDFRVTLKHRLTFHAGNGPDTLRRTRPAERDDRHLGRPGLWIFGCSFTYGWAVDDEATYAWRLQEALPGFDVVNFAVTGYGEIHALIQLREALDERPAPAVVVVAYAGFHDERNTFLRTRRKNLVPWKHLGPLVQPYARLEQGRLVIRQAEVEYRPFPFMDRSAFSHYLEKHWNRREELSARSHEVSQRLISEIADLARGHGARLVLATITDDPGSRSMLETMADRGVAAVDLSVDLERQDYTAAPVDHHPNPLAHAHYAEALEAFLRAEGIANSPQAEGGPTER